MQQMAISVKNSMRGPKPLTATTRSNAGTVVTKANSAKSRLSLSESASDDEMALLSDDGEAKDTGIEDHELRTAPLFTREAYKSTGRAKGDGQYGVFGRILSFQCVSYDLPSRQTASPRMIAGRPHRKTRGYT
ncbi:hypothetical protein L227DRAFT_1225 [Lentinus tigrinus ALCF2SS1-6]|uniref:Uncharacterized protein n=1 Tax=Lentinus tigrinus ALCF2SS1-6 TaxID=1328759 RepID=A0A5C2SUF7_9APHY|nr:hypothetical protein L227DRAFT_1225 [Lentinus tigrinus ALCF2SS1-6]